MSHSAVVLEILRWGCSSRVMSGDNASGGVSASAFFSQKWPDGGHGFYGI